MSWYDKSSGRKAFLLRHLGADGTVYTCPRMALILTSGIEKEAQKAGKLSWVLHPQNGFSSTHQVGMLSCQSYWSSLVSTSKMGGSDR